MISKQFPWEREIKKFDNFLKYFLAIIYVTKWKQSLLWICLDFGIKYMQSLGFGSEANFVRCRNQNFSITNKAGNVEIIKRSDVILAP